MKTKISALIDGELDQSELREVCTALRHDADLRRAASAYALIGDALRHEPYLASDISGAVFDRLAAEPVVLAPRGWAGSRPAHNAWQRPLLALAATLAGVAVVAWMGLTTQPAVEQLAQQVQQKPVVMATADDDMQEYLIAHQVHGGSGYLNGETQHVRAVSLNGVESRR